LFQIRSVVGFLIVANIIVYGFQMLFGPRFDAMFALWPWGEFDIGYATVGFEPWQLITSAFMHDRNSLAHIALNMFALYQFGGDVERVMGSRAFAWLYGASILTGSLVQLAVVSMDTSGGIGETVGASGGVFGVLLAFGMLFPRRRVLLLIPPIPMPAWVLVAGYGAIELVQGVLGTQQGVAHFAHLGGMLGAFIVLFTMGRETLRRARQIY
jgi:membrane associated rhomboid family serine protease